MKLTSPLAGGRTIACACFLLAMLFAGASAARAQALPSGRANRGMKLYETFAGSSSSSGSVFNITNTLGYDFTGHIGVDVSLPIYFVRPPANNGFAGSAAGIGNPSIDARLSLELPLLDYSPTATVSFPTGSITKGYNTGSVTYDLDNRFEHDFSRLTPFFDVDVGNSLNNGSSATRHQIQRPYMTLGKAANFMAGFDVHPADRWTVSADGYEAVPWGPQTVFSRIVLPGTVGKGGQHNRSFEIFQQQDGGAELVSDDGADASVAFSPTHSIDLTLAFDRSFHYALNTISFSVGFNNSQILSRKHD
jgi:hypothetical protein